MRRKNLPFVLQRLELLPNPAMLIRNGWTRKRSMEALKAGTPITITYRVEADQTFVSPDGTSIAVNARSLPSTFNPPIDPQQQKVHASVLVLSLASFRL